MVICCRGKLKTNWWLITLWSDRRKQTVHYTALTTAPFHHLQITAHILQHWKVTFRGVNWWGHINEKVTFFCLYVLVYIVYEVYIRWSEDNCNSFRFEPLTSEKQSFMEPFRYAKVILLFITPEVGSFCSFLMLLRSKSIHPSIFYRLILRSGRGWAGAYPSSLRARGGVRSKSNIIICFIVHLRNKCVTGTLFNVSCPNKEIRPLICIL